jgi:pilus assembly protein CpaE
MSKNVCVHRLPEIDGRSLRGLNVVASTAVQQELLSALTALPIDAVILDLDEPNALATILKVAEVRPGTAIVGVTGDADIHRIVLAQRAGCAQVATRPIDPDDLVNAVHRALGQAGSTPASSRMFAVLGSVGGAGSTTIATYLAVEIAQLMKEATALFDLDLECGGVADAFDLEPKHTIADLASAGAIDALVLEQVGTVVSAGVRVFARPPTIQIAHTIEESTIRSALEVARRAFPYTVLDLPHTLSALTGVAIELSTRLILVIQLTVPSIRNARRIIEAITGAGVPDEHIDILVNRYRKHGSACTIAMAEHELGRPMLATVPSDFKAVHSALDVGQPLLGKNPVRAAVREMATRLTGYDASGARAARKQKLTASR